MRRAARSSTPTSTGCAARAELDNLGWDEAIDRRDRHRRMAGARRRSAARRPARSRRSVSIRRDGPDFRRADAARHGRGGPPPGAGARGCDAPGARRLERREARIPAGRRLDSRLRAADEARRRDGDPDDLAAAAATGRSCATASPMRRSPSCRPTSAPSSPWRRACAASATRRPRLIAHSVEEGLALIEDFGAETIAEGGVPDGARYAEAIALLADLHGRELPESLPVGDEILRLPVYDIEAMLIEVELALDWYAPAVARVTPPSGARMQFLGDLARAAGADSRPADDLDAARLSFAQPALARRAAGACAGSA